MYPCFLILSQLLINSNLLHLSPNLSGAVKEVPSVQASTLSSVGLPTSFSSSSQFWPIQAILLSISRITVRQLVYLFLDQFWTSSTTPRYPIATGPPAPHFPFRSCIVHAQVPSAAPNSFIFIPSIAPSSQSPSTHSPSNFPELFIDPGRPHTGPTQSQVHPGTASSNLQTPISVQGIFNLTSSDSPRSRSMHRNRESSPFVKNSRIQNKHPEDLAIIPDPDRNPTN
ncbi:hypothetical protein DL98DRAFT_537278 [Cadophora sp. DSE1049]|nr:hypothetical protein DL98DRAFT_537278 [Cadophora sp. DSE1049]